jgi:hypothetical protein
VFWQLTWRDNILKWNDTKYKDIKKMTLKVKDVWVPEIFIVNAVNDMHMSKPKDSDYVDVMFDGQIRWFPANHLITLYLVSFHFKMLSRQVNCQNTDVDKI